jgi:predicted DNA-binding transcriptional regulator AlpA
MKNSTILHEVTPEQITSLFEGLQNQLTEIKKDFQPKQPTEYLTRNEVAELLKCDLSTLWNWQRKGKLIPVGIGNRVLYKRSDIEAVLIPLGTKKGGLDE